MFKLLRSNGETWLICGGRDFSNEVMFKDAMGDLMLHFGHPSRIIHGAAKGADSMAGDLGKRLAIDVLSFQPNWKRYGRSAGPIRNEEMLTRKPSKIIAFPGGRGTADMVRRARLAGIDVVEIKPS